MISRISRKILRTVWPTHWRNFSAHSFSQNGEDVMVGAIFAEKRDGFFVDVGAHHPYRFSNTYLLYRTGWSGLNIDALPGTERLFKRLRPRDSVVEVGISEHEGMLEYAQFAQPAYNTFDKERMKAVVAEDVSPLIGTKLVPTMPLVTVLDRHLPAGKVIDLLSVDLEGFDLQALRTNDWSRYRPRVVLAEILSASVDDIEHDAVHLFMRAQGYRIVSKLNTTAVFICSE